jgi:hypothetical protein
MLGLGVQVVQWQGEKLQGGLRFVWVFLVVAMGVLVVLGLRVVLPRYWGRC